METSLVTCVICPKGCSISVDWREENGERIIDSVRGNSCRRGLEYASSEVIHPVRVLASTVRMRNAGLKLLPVRSASPLPKELIFKAMEEVRKTVVEGDVKMGDVIIHSVAGSGIDMIASRSSSSD